MIIENYKHEVDQAVKKFRRDVEKIERSDNPYYNTPGVKEYEAQQLRQELEKAVQGVETRFNIEIDPEIEQAKQTAARSFFTPTVSDKSLVADAVSELVADVTLAYTDNQKLEAFERFEIRIEQLEESGLWEVRRKLPEVLGAIGQDETITRKLKGLNATLRALKTPEQEVLSDLEQVKINGVAASFNRLKLTHIVYKDYVNNRYHA